MPWVLARTGFDVEAKEKPPASQIRSQGVTVVGVLQADFQCISPAPRLCRTRHCSDLRGDASPITMERSCILRYFAPRYGGFKGACTVTIDGQKRCCVLFVCINTGSRSLKMYYLSRVCGRVSRQFARYSLRWPSLFLSPPFPRQSPCLSSLTMATVAGRKKSIVSNSGLVIETPVANNNILNKAASASTSLYQQCSSLRARLMRIPNFSHFFILSSPNGDLRQSTDPVTQLWDCFTLGIPLCFLFNLLPPPTRPIAEISTDPATFDLSNEKEKKRAIAKFAMRLSEIDNCERFTVSDLWDRHSTDGLVKVRGFAFSIPFVRLTYHRLSALSLPLSTFYLVTFSSPLQCLPLCLRPKSR